MVSVSKIHVTIIFARNDAKKSVDHPVQNSKQIWFMLCRGIWNRDCGVLLFEWWLNLRKRSFAKLMNCKIWRVIRALWYRDDAEIQAIDGIAMLSGFGPV